VLVPRYKLSLFHTPIKPDLLGFLGIDVFACGLRDHEVRIKMVQSVFHVLKGNPSPIRKEDFNN
jgi:hypothetical protein